MMRKMKDSGNEWLSEIPSSWEIARIGSLYSLRNTKVSDINFQPLSVTNKGVLPQLETVAKTNAHDDRKLVRKGDFAINSRSDRRGSCGISSYDGSVSLIYTVLAPLGEMNPQYYDWLFHTIQFADEFYKWGHGIVDDLWTTSWQEMKKIQIPFPPLPEQRRIADFLDAKCAEIDALCADIQAEIDTLEEYKRSVITETVTKGLDPNAPMKDSGIPGVGKVRKDWVLRPLKYVSVIVRGGSPRPIEHYMADDDTGYNWIRIGDSIKGSKYITSTFRKLLPKGLSKTRFIKKGSLILSNSMSFGQPYILGIDGCIHDGWVAFSEIKINQEYLYYFLMSEMAMLQFQLQVSGGVVQNLNIDKIGSTKIAVPSPREQEKIIQFLDAKCAEIDATIAEKRESITTLSDYKKSLIYEYVTGKKEVPHE